MTESATKEDIEELVDTTEIANDTMESTDVAESSETVMSIEKKELAVEEKDSAPKPKLVEIVTQQELQAQEKEKQVPVATSESSGKTAGSQAAKPASAKPASRGFRKIIKNIGIFFMSLAFRNTIKGALAFWVAILFILINPLLHIFTYPQVYLNTVLSTIVLSPGRTLGDFLDAAFLSIAGSFIGGLAWTLINVISGNNYPGMLVLVLIVIYGLSAVRAWGGARLFVFTLLPSIMAFQGLYFTVLNGTWNRTIMLESLYAFLLGIGICVFFNIFVFPHTAEADLRGHLAKSCINISTFTSYIIKTYLATITKEEAVERDRLAAVLRADQALLTRELDQVDAEITYSEFSVKDYASFIRSIHILQQHVLAVHTNLQQTVYFQNSSTFLSTFSAKLREPLELLEMGVRKAMAFIANKCDRKFGITIPKRPIDADVEAQKIGNKPVSELQHLVAVDKNGNPIDFKTLRTCSEHLAAAMSLFRQRQNDVLLAISAEEITDYQQTQEDVDLGDDITLLESSTKTKGRLPSPRLSRSAIFQDQQLWDGLFMCYFFMFGVHEFVEEVTKLRDSIVGRLCDDGVLKPRKKKLRIHYRHFLPFIKKAHKTHRKPVATTSSPSLQQPSQLPGTYSTGSAVGGPTDIIIRRRNVNSTTVTTASVAEAKGPANQQAKPQAVRFATARRHLLRLFAFFESKESIYGVKCAAVIAVVTLLLLLEGPSRTFFAQWNVQSAVTTILVLMSPTLGQTYKSFAFQLIGTAIGVVWGLFCFGAAGYNPYGLAFMVIVYAFPMVYILLNTPRFQIGLLSLLSFATMFTPSIALRDAPPSQNLVGGPFVRAYKAFVVLGIGCGLVFFFSVVLYPNLARRELRVQLSKVFDGIGGVYHYLIQLNSTDSELPPTGPMCDAMAARSEASRIFSRLKKAEGHLQLSIVRLQPLLQFAALEPRLAGPFQADTYRKLVQLLQVMLDRLITARLCIGSTGFSKEVMRDLMGPTFEPRYSMHATVRNLLYIYSSALISNKELPNRLPSAVDQRQKLFTIIYETLAKNQIDIARPNEHDLHTSGYLRVYAYHLSMRDFTNKIDEIAPLLKHLFGEQEELALLEATSESDWSEVSSIIEEELAEVVEEDGQQIQGDARLENEIEQLA